MAVKNILLILAREIAFGKAEIMNSIEQIGLANAIAAGDSDNPLGEGKLRMKVVFELKK